MLKVNTQKTLVDFKGKKLVADIGGDVFLGTILSNVMGGKVSNPTLGWQLGKKFATQDTVELKAEEVVFVKQEVTNVSGPGGWMGAQLAGQVLEILEGQEEESEE